MAQFLDPSALISHGLTVVYPVWERYTGIMNVLMADFLAIQSLLATVLILCAFIWMAIQIFLVSVEFYIVTTLAVIMIPFGLFKPTAFLADRAFGAIFAVCIKLMVLVFVASLSLPVVQGLAFASDNPTFHETLTMLIGVGAVALVMVKAPVIAAGMVSGSAGFELSQSMLRPLLSAASAALPLGSSLQKGIGAISKGVGSIAKATHISSDVPK